MRSRGCAHSLSPPLSSLSLPSLRPPSLSQWCGHCKQLAPQWEEAATALKKAGVAVALAKVDATLESAKALAERYGVRGYPTIKMFRGGDGAAEAAAEYSGPREAAGIVAFLTKQAAPAVVALSSQAEAAAELAAAGALVVALVAPGGGEPGAAFAGAAAAQREDFSFVTLSDASHLPATAAPVPDGLAPPAVVLLKTFDEPLLARAPFCGPPVFCLGFGFVLFGFVNFYSFRSLFLHFSWFSFFHFQVVPADVASDQAALEAWLLSRGLPRVAVLGHPDARHQRAIKAAFDSPTPKLVAFHGPAPEAAAADGGAAAEDEPLVAAVRAAASAPGGDAFKFIVAAAAGNENALKYFGLEAGDAPALVVQASVGGADKKFVKKGASPSDLAPFLAAYAAGELTAVVKSEKPPADNVRVVGWGGGGGTLRRRKGGSRASSTHPSSVRPFFLLFRTAPCTC